MTLHRDPRAESDWLVARFLGQRPGPVVQADGLVVTDCTGVIRGNDDLVCEWVPTTVVPGTTPLPSHETDAALASIEIKGERA